MYMAQNGLSTYRIEGMPLVLKHPASIPNFQATTFKSSTSIFSGESVINDGILFPLLAI